jgi:hypothetical protein
LALGFETDELLVDEFINFATYLGTIVSMLKQQESFIHPDDRESCIKTVNACY